MKSTWVDLVSEAYENIKGRYIMFNSQLQDLLEGVDRILTTYGVSFHASYMIVRRQHDSDCVFRDYISRR
jgi:hypothetical protein